MRPAMCSHDQPFTGVHGECAAISVGVSGGFRPVLLVLHRSLDTTPGRVLLAHDALRVDPWQDGDALPCPFRYLGGGHPGVEPRHTAAWRRSYGTRASGDRASAGVSAIARALCHTLVTHEPERTQESRKQSAHPQPRSRRAEEAEDQLRVTRRLVMA